MSVDSSRLNDLASALNAISPLDGRYKNKVSDLSKCFSEYSLIKNRYTVELRYWFEFLKITQKLPQNFETELRKIIDHMIENFEMKDAIDIKILEETLCHDVKSVEKYVTQKLIDSGKINDHTPQLVHFGLTSHDINSLAMNMQLRDGLNCLVDHFTSLQTKILMCSLEWETIPMLARTHGQPATPVSLGTQFAVFYERMASQTRILKEYQNEFSPLPVKFGGATGGLNAHKIAYPEIDWEEFADKFTLSMGFSRSFPTTQVEHFDTWSSVFDTIRRTNGILIDFSRDIWMYVSYGYLSQSNKTGEVGSSTMPHKINPIQFENAEGNLLLANVLLQFFSQQFQLSRMQRDLVNSTLWRNVGVAFGHTLLSIQSLLSGVSRITPNLEILNNDLENHYEVLSEPLQILLRKYGKINAYDHIKDLFRGITSMNQTQWRSVIDKLNDCSVIDKLNGEHSVTSEDSVKNNIPKELMDLLYELSPTMYCKSSRTKKRIKCNF